MKFERIKKLLRNFLYSEVSNGKKYLKINLFGIRLSLNLSLKNNTNKIYLKTRAGELKRVRKIKGLKIIFEHSNSTVIVHEPIIKFANSSVVLGENCHFEIGAKTKDELVKMSGVNFVLAKNAKARMGDNLFFGGGDVVLTENSSLTIGNDCMLSYGLTLRIGDAHPIINSKTGETIPNQGNVIIADRVWVGVRAIILKNAQIAHDTIVGAGSVVTKKFDTPNVAIAGNPARIVKEDVAWEK